MYSDEQGFYITLPSESSRDVFPENNPSEYTVRLPRWIQLKGEWEIGLHSIAYTPWNIVQPLDEPISFMNGGNKGKGGKMRKHYSSVKEYIEAINDSQSHIEFVYESNGKVTAHLSPGYTVRLRREQAIVLGFMTFEDSSETYDIENVEESGQYKANLYRETKVVMYRNNTGNPTKGKVPRRFLARGVHASVSPRQCVTLTSRGSTNQMTSSHAIHAPKSRRQCLTLR